MNLCSFLWQDFVKDLGLYYDIYAQVLNVCGCFCVLVMLANLGFYENHMYSESYGIETVAKYYVFVKWFQV